MPSVRWTSEEELPVRGNDTSAVRTSDDVLVQRDLQGPRRGFRGMGGEISSGEFRNAKRPDGCAPTSPTTLEADFNQCRLTPTRVSESVAAPRICLHWRGRSSRWPMERAEKLNYQIQQWNNLLEPLLIQVIGVVVAFVPIEVYLPMFSLGITIFTLF